MTAAGGKQFNNQFADLVQAVREEDWDQARLLAFDLERELTEFLETGTAGRWGNKLVVDPSSRDRWFRIGFAGYELDADTPGFLQDHLGNCYVNHRKVDGDRQKVTDSTATTGTGASAVVLATTSAALTLVNGREYEIEFWGRYTNGTTGELFQVEAFVGASGGGFGSETSIDTWPFYVPGTGDFRVLSKWRYTAAASDDRDFRVKLSRVTGAGTLDEDTGNVLLVVKDAG